MGLRITKGKKAGTYHVYCTVTDKYCGRNVPRQQVIDFYLERAREHAQWEIDRWLEQIDTGKDWFNR